MTVATLVSTVSYVGNGVSTVYTYPFYIIDASHLHLWVNGALQSINAYTVTSVGNQFGGEVAFAVAPLVGQQIDIKRNVPATQLVDYRPYDPFPAEVHEQALDKLTMIVQGNTGGIANAVRAPYLEPVGATNLVLPGAATRANQVLGFDLSGNVMLYPFVGVPPFGISDHGQLSGLADDDHPQYLKVAAGDATYLKLTGGTLTGRLLLPPGFPTLAVEAVPKAYVDTFTGSVLTKNVVSDATGDAQGTVQNAWNAQANSLAITRASNEIIYYRWKSTDTSVFRYVGSQQGPVAWATTAAEWVSAAGVTEAPQDGFVYGRTGGTWAQVVARSGGGYLGKVQGFAGAAAPADLARTDEAQILADAAVDAHEALLDPHPQYPLKADIVGTVVQDPQPAGMKQGQQWYESDTGGYYMRYVNPDATETLVSLAGAGGDFMPFNNGRGLFADGTQAAPAISWANETGTGFWRAGTGNVGFTINGAYKFSLSTVAASVVENLFLGKQLMSSDGTLAAPGISWANEPTTGWHRVADQVRLAIAGTLVQAERNGNGLYSESRINSGTPIPHGIEMFFSGVASAQRGVSNFYLTCVDNSGAVCNILSNGGLNNVQANNVNISDANGKHSIAPSPDYTTFVEQLQFKRFGYTDFPNDGETDGVIAQEIAALAPELTTTIEGTIGIYEHRLQQRINSVIPKLIERIKALEEKLTALEAK